MAFVDRSNATVEREYDENGNMTKDLDRNICSIRYNALNLPDSIILNSGAMTTFLYSADGTKLQMKVTTAAGSSTVTKYMGNLVYENGVASRVLTGEGYLNRSNGTYHFFLTDHQGNVRVVTDAAGSQAEEVNHYYPFGALFVTSSNVQPYKYNGKEAYSQQNLDLYDYGARLYDPLTARFTTSDPLCEKYYHISPYAYCAGNPVNFVDPDGRAWRPTFTYNRDGSKTNNGYEWVDESESYDKNGNLLEGLYHQAIFFSDNGTFDAKSSKNIGSSTATVYLADGTTTTFEACTYPSDLDRCPSVPEGMYEAKVGTHHGSKTFYTALKMFDVGKSPTDNKIELGFTNPAFHDGRTYAEGIDIHKAGLYNRTKAQNSNIAISAGCLLIDFDKWDDFISLFDNKNTISVTLSRSLSSPFNRPILGSFIPFYN